MECVKDRAFVAIRVLANEVGKILWSVLAVSRLVREQSFRTDEYMRNRLSERVEYTYTTPDLDTAPVIRTQSKHRSNVM